MNLVYKYFYKLSQRVVNLSEIRTSYEIDFESRLMGRQARPRSKSQFFYRYCIPHRFSTLSLKSTLRARFLKSDVYSSDYDDSIVESVFLLDYCSVISISCMLPANLATYLFNLLIGLLAH